MNTAWIKKFEHQKVTVFTMAFMFVLAASMVATSLWFLKENTSEVARFYLGENSKNLSQSLDNELRNLVEKSRMAWSYASSKSDAGSDRKEYIAESLKSVPGIQAAEVYFRQGNSVNPNWRSGLYVPIVDNPFRSVEDVTFEFASKGFVEIQTFFDLENHPYLRLVIPVKRKKFTTPKEIITAEVSYAWLKPFFKSDSSLFHFLVDTDGRLIAQTQEDHFSLGENLEHLVIVQQAQESEESGGQLNYKEMPDSETQLAAFHKIGESGLVVISQINEGSHFVLLKNHRGKVMFLGFAVILAALFSGFMIIRAQRSLHTRKISDSENVFELKTDRKHKKAA